MARAAKFPGKCIHSLPIALGPIELKGADLSAGTVWLREALQEWNPLLCIARDEVNRDPL